MKLLALSVLVSLTALSVACSKNDPAPPAVDLDTGTIEDTGTTRDTAVGDTSVDGTVDSAADATDGAVDAPEIAACPKVFPGDKATPVVYEHGSGELLAGLTWDELTMVWTTNEAGKIVVHYADRTNRDEAFGAAKTLPDSLGPFGEDTVALAADGKSMIFVSADHGTLTRVTRSARGVAFDAPVSTTAFNRITGPGSEGGAAKKLGDLVLSKDGKWLFYTDLNRTAGTTLMLSIQLGDGTWDYPNPIDGKPFEAVGSMRRRPTGVSADKLTLFYYDETTATPLVAFRTPGTALFYETKPYLPVGKRPMPAEACDRVYLTMGALLTPPSPDGGLPDVTLPDVGADGEKPDAASKALTIQHAP